MKLIGKAVVVTALCSGLLAGGARLMEVGLPPTAFHLQAHDYIFIVLGVFFGTFMMAAVAADQTACKCGHDYCHHDMRTLKCEKEYCSCSHFVGDYNAR